MADGALELDDFLSRFQLRPQLSRNALNQRQAAVLVLSFVVRSRDCC
jgi:hypothetical protein